MDNFTATGIAEGFVEADSEEQVVEAWQHLIDTGLAWQLQGWFGRNAQALIEDGVCHAQESLDYSTSGHKKQVHTNMSSVDVQNTC